MTVNPDDGAEPIPRRSHFADLTPFRTSPAFFRLWLGTTLAGIGSQLTLVAVGLHVYAMTDSTAAVALVGVIALVPMILAGLYGGVLADTFDRRIVALVAETAAWASVIGLAALAWTGSETLWLYYLFTTLNAVSVTIVAASRSAIIPRLLPKHLLPAAGGLNGIGFGFQIIVGPAIAGVLVATIGVQWTYSIDAVLFLAAFTGILTLPPIKPEGDTRAGVSAVVEGLAFLRQAPNIRMSFLLDIIAMSFGMVRALLPAVGALVIGGGAVTVGILSSAFASGVLLSSVLSGRLGTVRWHGLAIRNSIMAFGASMLGFGVVLLVAGSSDGGTNWLALAVACVFLAAAGGADNISSVFRSTMLQSAVPDAMRGRTQGIFIVVVTGGPRLGDLYVGIVATTALLWLPSVLGGVLIIALTFTLVHTHRRFHDYDALNPTP